jgi:hypothetical protein
MRRTAIDKHERWRVTRDRLARRVYILLILVTKLSQTKDHLDLEARETRLFTNGGETMIYASHRTTRLLFALFFVYSLAFAFAGAASAQEKKVGQTNGVDNSKMGAYRALAQHMYADFQKGDLAAAAELGTVLERLWDKAEEYGGDTALAKTNRKLFDQIDKAMDQFILPITQSKGKAPDPATVKAAYNAYLEKLKLAD